MHTLSQIRRSVDALKRKYAAELTVIKLYPLAEDFCLLWTCAVADGNPVPDTHAFIRTIARNGVRLDTFTLLVHYLERCSNEDREPDSLSIISILLPQVPCEQLREMLRWMAPVLDERTAQSAQPYTLGSAGPPARVHPYLAALILQVIQGCAHPLTPNPTPRLVVENSSCLSPIPLVSPL